MSEIYNQLRPVVAAFDTRISEQNERLNDLKSDLTDVYTDVKYDINSIASYKNESVNVESVSGICATDGTTNTSSASYAHISVPVTGGEKYLVSGMHYSDSSYPSVMFLADGSYLTRVDSATTGSFEDLQIVVPVGADEMIVNGLTSYALSATKLVYLKYATSEEIRPLYTSNMEQGSLSAVSYGQSLRLIDSTYTIRQKEFSSWTAGMKVSVKDGYQARLMLCDSDGGFITDASWSQTVTHNNTTATKVKVLIRNVDSSATLTPDEAVSVVVYSDIPIINIKPKADVDDLIDLESEISAVNASVTEIKETMSTLYVYNNVPVTLETGVYDKYGGSAQSGKHISISVTEGEKYIVIANCYVSNDYPICLFRKNGTIVGYKKIVSSQLEQVEVIIPETANEMIVNSAIAYIEVQKGTQVSARPYSKWHGKKIAWFGTSIPEKSSYNAVIGYPEYTGKLLGATVYNEAVGSSCARRGFKSNESENDPYGWTGMGQAALWNMGSNLEEKDEILTNWESKWRSATGYNIDLTDGIRTKTLNCSYENKLLKYIEDNPVDLYVFDHGYNDWSNNAVNIAMDESDPFDMSTYQGAMNTYIKLILTANPRARIILLSHYETQERPTLVPMQEAVAKYWNLPFCRICDYLGWAKDRTIESDGYWSNGTGSGVWIQSGGTVQTYNLKQLHIPDGRHPNLDISGHACMDIAEIIADFIDHITPSN